MEITGVANLFSRLLFRRKLQDFCLQTNLLQLNDHDGKITLNESL